MRPSRTTRVVRAFPLSVARALGASGEGNGAGADEGREGAGGRMRGRSIQSRSMMRLFPLLAALGLCLGSGGAAAAAGKVAPRFYFAVVDVKSDFTVDDDTRTVAKEVLAAELASRPEFTSDLGGVTGEALVAELARRKLKGFDVSMKLVSLTHELQPPRPGGRLKQLAVGTKLSVFGTTIGEAKLAFGGDGEATVVAEVVERRLAEETKPLDREVLVQAVRQAVDQAVGKLGQRASQPFNESKTKRKPKAK
jgi:hypothetical protein